MAISVEIAEYILFHHLKMFKTAGKFVDHVSIFKEVLDDTKTVGLSPRSLYNEICRYDLFNNGASKSKWPNTWIDESCKSLALIVVKESQK